MSILRTIIAVISVIVLSVSLIAIAFGVALAFGLWLFAIGLLLTLGVLFERVHYKRLLSKTPGPGWIATAERFVDPVSGRMVQVFTNPTTGERLYVDADATATGSLPGPNRQTPD